MSHQINLDELIKWQLEEKALFASSSRENKRLYATLRGSYQVFSNNVLVLETMQPASAVDKYNSL